MRFMTVFSHLYSLIFVFNFSSLIGGIGAYYRKNCAISPWEPTPLEKSLDAERIWMLIGGTRKMAICGVYLKTEDKPGSEHHTHNAKLLSMISAEKTSIESKGFETCVLGDFNAWIKPSDAFLYTSYKHIENNNGKLLANFVKENNLFCLNPIMWKGVREEKSTYQRSMGNRFHESTIDYILATPQFTTGVSEARVTDVDSLSVDSDHSTLLVRLKPIVLPAEAPVKLINPMRRITAWGSFKQHLEKRMANKHAIFCSKSIVEQGEWLTDNLLCAGRNSVPGDPVNLGGKQRKKKRILRTQLLRARRRMRQAVRNEASEMVLASISRLYDRKKAALNKLMMMDIYRRKTRLRRLITAKSSDASKIFWSTINGKPPQSSGIKVLAEDGVYKFDANSKTKIIEDHFQDKFATQDQPQEAPGVYDIPDDDVLGHPDVKLTDEQSKHAVRPINMEELADVLDHLDPTKAEGSDGITNSMLKHSGPEFRCLLLEFYNNVLAGGVNPNGWKDGLVVLLLKRAPAEDIKNYRPITLISCLSKVLSKLMSQRISAAIEDSGIAGDLQNGFRKDRSCADNLFMLNAMLELNKHYGHSTHMMFVDLQEAYDRVDRGILFRKMRQLNFPRQLICYLEEYYFGDYIHTLSGGQKSKRQYQTRGLRQGCPLSAILFVIYLIELSSRLDKTGMGTWLSPGFLLSYFLFADDLLLAANNETSLNGLKSVLEQWARDFRMRISHKKTQVISHSENVEWCIADPETGEPLTLEQVEEYRYLGVTQKLTLRRTTNEKTRQMLEKTMTYVNLILRLRATTADKVATYLAIWQNVALPSILYGCEALPIPMDVIDSIQLSQNKIGKILLGVPKSTANETVAIELGLKPILLLVLTAKIKFVMKCKNHGGCMASKRCLTLLENIRNSDYLSNLKSLLSQVNLTYEDINLDFVNLVDTHFKSLLFNALRYKKSLALLPTPSKFWRKSVHVEEGEWSMYLSKYRSMNAGLGNRDTICRNYGVPIGEGRIVHCPLCITGDNTETHVLVDCTKLLDVRSRIMVGNLSLSQTLITIAANNSSIQSSNGVARAFLGQEVGLTRTKYIQRGKALKELTDEFFRLWSTKEQAHIPRRIVLNPWFIA